MKIYLKIYFATATLCGKMTRSRQKKTPKKATDEEQKLSSGLMIRPVF